MENKKIKSQSLKLRYFKKIIISIFIVLLVSIGIVLYVLSPFPTKDNIVVKCPEYFAIEKENQFEVQGKNQCSAFSTAYLLRHFTINSSGKDVYKNIDFKIPFSGYVLPNGLINYFQKNKLNAKLLCGNIDTLKTQVSKGTPIIVLTGHRISWYHYMTVIGYDSTKKEIYFFDSKKQIDENKDQPGNRTIKEEYFKELWNTKMPFFNNAYFVVKGRENES